MVVLRARMLNKLWRFAQEHQINGALRARTSEKWGASRKNVNHFRFAQNSRKNYSLKEERYPRRCAFLLQWVVKRQHFWSTWTNLMGKNLLLPSVRMLDTTFPSSYINSKNLFGSLQNSILSKSLRWANFPQNLKEMIHVLVQLFQNYPW